MSEQVKVELRLTDGLELTIVVPNYENFVESVRFRDAATVITDTATGLNVFALAIATYKRVK